MAKSCIFSHVLATMVFTVEGTKFEVIIIRYERTKVRTYEGRTNEGHIEFPQEQPGRVHLGRSRLYI